MGNFDLAMVVPSRGRPQSVANQVAAWEANTSERASLIWALDEDDPTFEEYRSQIVLHRRWMDWISIPSWVPMVPKLNAAARELAPDFPCVGFMGDDHLPRTPHWDRACALAAANGQEPAIVYGRDGLQDIRLPTWWVMSSSVIKALGRMVPADVQHMYCDNAVKELGEAAGILRYLPEVLVEHMHPVAGKAEWDDQYKRVNRQEQYERDRSQFDIWRRERLREDATLVRSFRGV